MSSLAVMPTLNEFAERIKNLERQLMERSHQLQDAQEELRQERAKNAQGAAAVVELRRVLTPLYTGLRAVFGEMEAISMDEVATGPEPRKRAVWAAWQAKLPGLPAKAIDALLVHGSLNQTQLRIHLGCARSSVPNVVMALNRAGLLNKVGGQISLKEL